MQCAKRADCDPGPLSSHTPILFVELPLELDGVAIFQLLLLRHSRYTFQRAWVVWRRWYKLCVICDRTLQLKSTPGMGYQLTLQVKHSIPKIMVWEDRTYMKSSVKTCQRRVAPKLVIFRQCICMSTFVLSVLWYNFHGITRSFGDRWCVHLFRVIHVVKFFSW